MLQAHDFDLTELPKLPDSLNNPSVAHPSGCDYAVPIDIDSALPIWVHRHQVKRKKSASPETPNVEVRIRKRIAKELKSSKRKSLRRDTVSSLLAVQDKLTSKDPSFSRKLSDYVEATKEDEEEEENSEDVLHYLRVVVENEK
jgi:hypothetical protein